MKLVISTSHSGLMAVFCASWLRCRVHFMLNVPGLVSRASQSVVRATLHRCSCRRRYIMRISPGVRLPDTFSRRIAVYMKARGAMVTRRCARAVCQHRRQRDIPGSGPTPASHRSERSLLMIHAGVDNHAHQPEKLGGGGTRMVCGVTS